MNLIRQFLLLICFLCIGTNLVKAQDQTPEVSKVPLAQMAKLDSLAGRWEMTVFATQDDGKNWQKSPTQLVEIFFQHKGMVLEEKPVSTDSPGFHMLSYIAYDQYRHVFRKAAIDDVWGIMDLYEGEIVDNKLIMTNLNSKTLFPVGNGKWRGFRLTIELKDGLRTMWIDKTDDAGKTWQKSFRAEYRASV